MNRYQVGAVLGGICVLLLIVCLAAWAAYLVRESIARRKRERMADAVTHAMWERRVRNSNGVTYVDVVQMARPAWTKVHVQVGDAVTVGSVAMNSPAWALDLDQLKFEADQRVFQLNLDLSG